MAKNLVRFGLEEGREEGREAKAVEVARQMKTDGMPAELIVKYTGLSLSTIQEL